MKLENLARSAKSLSRKALTSLLISSSLLINTCGDNKPNKPVEPPKETVKFAENVKLLSQETLDNISFYDDKLGGQIVFSAINSQISSLRQGDIILPSVPTPDGQARFGFLRRVESVSQDKKNIITSQATLADAIEEANLKLSKRLTPQDIVSHTSLPGVAKPSSSESFDFNIPLNRVLYDADGNSITTNDQVVLNGNFNFNYDFNLELEVGFFKLKKLRLENTATESLELKIDSKPNFTLSKEITLAQYTFSPIPIPGTILYVIPTMDIVAGINGEALAKFSTGISQSAELYAGIVKENGEWSAPMNFTSTFDFQPPTIIGNANFKGYAGPRMNLMVYGILGGYGSIEGSLELKANFLEKPKWVLYGGLEASVGIEDKIFGWADYDADIINYEKEIARDTITPIIPSFIARPNSGNAPLEVLLDASASTGPITDYKFIFGDGTSNYIEKKTSAPDGAFDGKTKHTYISPGMYIPEVVIANGSTDYVLAYDTVNVSEVGGPTGKIVFVSERGHLDYDIYTMNIDGSDERLVTSREYKLEMNPSWSPDGRKIIYSSTPSGGGRLDVHVINSDGSNKVRLTSTGDRQEDIAIFSPDGTKIAYTSYLPANACDELYVMNSDGSNPREIGLDYLCYYDLAWSPDGKKIAFLSLGDDQLCIMNIDGSGLKKLTDSIDRARYPSFSPDGAKIAFSKWDAAGSGNNEIYVMNSDGSNQRNISNSPNTNDDMPSYSPDGKFIVYSSEPRDVGITGDAELWTMRIDGTGKKRITNNSYNELNPKWAPK